MRISNLYENEEHDFPGVRSENLLVLSGVMSRPQKGEDVVEEDSRLSIIKNGDTVDFWVQPNPLDNVLGRRRPFASFSLNKMLKFAVRNSKQDVVDRFKSPGLAFLRAAVFVATKPGFRSKEVGHEISLRHTMVNVDDAESEVCIWIDNYSKGDDITLNFEVTYSVYTQERGYNDDWATVRWKFPLHEDYNEEFRDFFGATHSRIGRHDVEASKNTGTYSSAARSSPTLQKADDYLNQHTPKQKKRGWF